VMQVGAPVSSPVAGEGDIRPGVLPAGRYAKVAHVGHPKELMGVTKALLEWAGDQGLRFDVTPTANGEEWACRLEVYHTDPTDIPDMSRWHTDLLFRLAD
jgi:effector-binding domain-containing protein